MSFIRAIENELFKFNRLLRLHISFIYSLCVSLIYSLYTYSLYIPFIFLMCKPFYSLYASYASTASLYVCPVRFCFTFLFLVHFASPYYCVILTIMEVSFLLSLSLYLNACTCAGVQNVCLCACLPAGEHADMSVNHSPSQTPCQ